MVRLRNRRILAAWLGLSLVAALGDAHAQTSSTAAASTAATSTASTTGTSAWAARAWAWVESGLMPMMSAMNPSAGLSPTDAAALGMPGSGNGMGMNPMNGVFMNPMAAPYLLGYPMTSTQIGGMMMMNGMGATGFGSGQLSGVRPGAGQARGRTTPQQVSVKPRATTKTPGGLAYRYFNRTVSVNRPVNVNRIPPNYYTRQNRYYPQVAR